MKMGVLGHHLGISWHGINLFPPHCCSVTKSSPTLDPMDTAAQQVSLSFTVPQSLLKHMFIESVIPSNHLTLSCLLPLLPSIFPSIMVFFSGLALRLRGPKYWSFQYPSEYSGLISFRIAWFDCLAVQGTLKSLLQHHSSKVSVLHCLAFFMVQLSLPYMTTGKTIALTIQTFVDKAMSLLFNRLSRFPIFLAYLVGLIRNVFAEQEGGLLKRNFIRKCMKRGLVIEDHEIGKCIGESQ